MNGDSLFEIKLHELKRLREIQKAHQGKAALSALRRQWLQKQKIQNYQSEYDKILSLLHETKTKDMNMSKLEARKSKLEELGAKAVNRIAN
jgi:hypothetical protein